MFEFLDLQNDVKPGENEYLGEDGLIYCSVCNKPKQALGELKCGMVMKHRSQCDCEKKMMEEQKRKSEAEEKRRIVSLLRKRCFENSKAIECTFENSLLNNAAYKLCFNYCEKWDEVKAKNISLLICGRVGGGKTYLASCVCNKLIMDYNVSAKFITEYDYINLYSASKEREALLDKLSDYSLLVLDDFGSKSYKKNAESNGYLSFVYDLIDTRYKLEKPVIITTNLPKELFKNNEYSGFDEQRIFSRIIEMTGTPIEVVSADMRKNKAKKKEDYLRTLVG